MNKLFLAILGVVIVVGGVVAYGSLFTVHQASQALVLQFGNPIRVERDPGLKFKVPFLQNVEYFDRRILDLDPNPQEVILKDQKRVNVDSFARYRIVDPLEFRKKVSTDIEFRAVFGGRLNSAVRAEVGKVLLGDMLTAKRAEVMHLISEQLKSQGADFGVEVIDVRIGRTDLPDTTSQAVYTRMRSSRVAQAAELRAKGEEQKAKIQAGADRERTVILANAQKEAEIARGQGEGARTTILNSAFGRDPGFFGFYRTMEAYGKAFDSDTSLVLSPNSDFMRFFGAASGDKQR
ncbi:MAG: protease modulator HflC [Rhodospirillaceae bacterium]|jgi:modulator of FtsH protease HflC|nr:protease modulator HflC [Rhodospirillaceae bacterium]MBT5245214.1 protease modulator HflC [Rhodospirillaceae bacterium]MBT5561940.1 protease modulator HflC [Rhodospirillaceae bacterium]MBT6241942.1 protease modulator HflC [Rhodospirillaceae bacterium]MBT7137849.1 protease modulator HflC [Rhodospirillaceae bacterium]